MNRRSALRMLGIGAAALAALPMVDVSALPPLPAPPMGLSDEQLAKLREAARRFAELDAMEDAYADSLRLRAMMRAYCRDPLCPACHRMDYVDPVMREGDRRVVTITDSGKEPQWPVAEGDWV